LRSAVTSSDPGFGIYVHWPFCASKCPYCDFNSHVRHGAIDQPRYLRAFQQELRSTRARIGDRRVHSIFFGGGTPSLMTPATVGGILAEIAALWTVEAGAEITLEANPSSVEAERFQGFRAAGVNRVSLGVQSLVEADLRALGRLHSVAEAKAAIAVARATFERFTFDLIYARPQQTEAAWRAELSEALRLAGDHLSLYQLTIEPDTPYEALARAGRLQILTPELADELWAITQDMTTAAGLPAYEISNHARSGQESRHNVLYWRYGEYAGVGPGAHGRLLVDGQRYATAAQRNPERWLQLVESGGHGLVDNVPLDRAEQADEALLMGLRLDEGLDLARLVRLGGVRPGDAKVAELISLGMIARVGNHDRIRATSRGRFVLNRLVEELSGSFVAVGG
jgi:putative oxygen-independent coproporphyrinogen III oxidase